MLKRVPVLFFVCAIMIISSLSLGAATTYWVSKTGDNSNFGTESSPFATIQHAINQCNGGDQYTIMVKGNDLGEYYEENITIPSNLNFESLEIIGDGDFISLIDEDEPLPQYGYSSRLHGLEGDNPTISIYHSNVTIKNLRILNLKRDSQDPFSEDNERNVLIYIAPGLENVVITQNNIGPQTGYGTVVNIYYDLSFDEGDDPDVNVGGTHGIFVDGNGSDIQITENEINGISGLGDAIRFEADETGFEDCTIQYNYSYNNRMSHVTILGKITNSVINDNSLLDGGFYEFKFNLIGSENIGEGAKGNGIVLLNNSTENIEDIEIQGNSVYLNLHTGIYIYGGVSGIDISLNDIFLNMDGITLNGDNDEPFFPGDPNEIDDNNSFDDITVYRNVIYVNTRFGLFNNTDYALCAQENYWEEPNEDFDLGGFDLSNGPQYGWGEFDHELYYFDGDNYDGGRTFYNNSANYKPAVDDPNVLPGASLIYGKVDFSPYITDLSDYSTRNITVNNSPLSEDFTIDIYDFVFDDDTETANKANEFDNISNAMQAVHSICGRDIVEVVNTNTNYSETFTIFNAVELVGIGGTPFIDPTQGPIITSVAAGDSKITGFQFNIPSSGGLGFIDNNGDYTGNVYMIDNTYFDESNQQLSTYDDIDPTITDDMDYTTNPYRGTGTVGQFIFDEEDNTPPTAIAKDITVQTGPGGTVTVDPEDLDDGSSDNSGGPLTFTILYDSDGDNIDEEYGEGELAFSVPGTYNVKLKVCDESGNCSTDDATITVEDNTPPTAKGKDITVQLGQNGEVTITTSDVDDGSSDNSGSVTLSFCEEEGAPNSLTFDAPGTYEVVLCVEDPSGNQSQATVLVTVVHYPFNLTYGVLWLDAGTTSQKCKGSKLPLSPPNTWSWEDLTQYDNHAKQQYKDNIPHTLPKKVGSTKKRGIFFNEHQCNEKNSDFLTVANASGNLNDPDYSKSIFVVFTTKNNIGDKCNCKEYNHKHDNKCKHDDEEDDDCGKCSGGVTKLTLKYTGNSGYIKVVQKDGQVIFSGYVYNNSTFSFTGKGSGNKMGTEIKIYINNCYYKSIHTSCSQPIGPGLVVGNFTVVSGESYKGGDLCAINSGGDDDDDDGDDDDNGKGTKKCKMVLFEMGGTSSGINFYIEDKKLYAGVWGGGKSHFRSFNISRKTTYMARLRYNSSTDRFDVYLNGSGHEGVGTVELGTDNSDNGVGAAVGGTRFHDGSFSGTGKFYDGYIGEIIVHNSANDEVWESTKDYLCSKYGFGNNCNNNWARENEEYVDYQMTDEVEIFEAYPNPFELNTNFSMAVRQAQPVSIELYNALGEKVQTIFNGNLEGQTYYEFNIDGSNLPSGIYIYKVSGTTFTRSGKLILNK